MTALDAFTLNGKAGPLPISRPIFTPLTAIGAAVARCWAQPVCTLAAAFAVPLAIESMERLRVKKDPVDGTIKLDPGIAPTASTVVPRYFAAYADTGIAFTGPYGESGGLYTSHGAAAAARLQVTNSTHSYSLTGFNDVSCPATPAAGVTAMCSGWYEGKSITTATGYTVYGYLAIGIKGVETGGGCPASVDPFNPAYSVPAGSPVGVDGKCPTARYNWTPISPGDVGLRMDAYPPTADPAWDGVTEDFKDAMQGGETAPGSTSQPMTGPSTQTGTPTTTTTTTSTGGSKTTTDTPTYNYTYGDTNITYNTTNTTITVEGGVTTTTTTTSAPTPAADEEDFCKQHPDVLSCVKVTEPASNDPAWEERTVTYEGESLGFSGSCPGPVTWTLPNSGVVMEWSYEPVCDVAPMVRLALLAIATIGAISIIIRETSS